MFTRALLLALMVSSLALVAPAASLAQATASVTGTVTYSGTSRLPTTARVIVQLLDVSRAGAPATVLSEQTIEPQGALPPYAFSLPYDPAQIDDRFSYAVRASIRDGDTLLYTTTTRISVITRGNPTSGVIVPVEPVQQPRPPAGPPQRVTITSPPEGTLVGSPVTISGRTERFPEGGVLFYRFTDERGQPLGSGQFPVEGSFTGPAAFTASLSFSLPPEGGDVRVEIFERDAQNREQGLARRSLFIARPQAIRITSPAEGAVVTSPLVVEGNLGRLPAGARLFYRMLASDGRQLAVGDFPVAGSPGRPTFFRASLPFDASPEGDRIQLQLFDQDQTSGAISAQAAASYGVAPQPQQIIISSPGPNAFVGTPVVLSGRTVRFPPSGTLGYAIYDGSGVQVGGGVLPVAGSLAVGGTFSASLGFSYPPQGGPLRIDLYDQDPVTGAFRASASLSLRTVPLQQQIVIESPGPGTTVGTPMVITGRTARYPGGGVLQYRVVDANGAQLGGGSFQVQGPFGEPARFTASIGFQPPTFSGPLRVEVFEADQFGNPIASATVELRWATSNPAQGQIVIETPAAGTVVGSPVTITGRTNFFPFEGTLSYRVRDQGGNELGVGAVQVRPEAGGSRFVISAAFRPVPGGGPIVVEVFAVSAADGSVVARDAIQLTQAP